MEPDLFELAQSWLEHCREQAEYFDLEGEDDTAEKWHNDAEDAEKAIKRAIDTPAFTKEQVDLFINIGATMADPDGGGSRDVNIMGAVSAFLVQHPDRVPSQVYGDEGDRLLHDALTWADLDEDGDPVQQS